MQAVATSQGGEGRGRRGPRKGKPRRLIPDNVREEIREARRNFEHLATIARAHGVSVAGVFKATLDIRVDHSF